MTQLRLNNVMVIRIHKGLTESINDLEVINQFSSTNEERIRHLESFETNLVTIMYFDECWVVFDKYCNFLLSQCCFC